MKPRLMTAAAMLAFAGSLIVVYNFPPGRYGFYPRCPIYAATRLLCPGCGATRALYELLHGNLAGALHYNAMFTLLAPFLLAGWVFCCYKIMRYDRFPRPRFSRAAIAALGLAVLLFTIGRNTFLIF